jgi:DNA-binding winged helix-turn-helix (wHTH) protein
MEPEHLESLYPTTTREGEIGKIFSCIKEGKSLQLISLPGAGRNYVLTLLINNRNIRIHYLGDTEQFLYHFILIPFAEIKNRSLFDVMKFIFLQLSSSLHERRKEEEFLVVDKLFKEALSYQDELVLFQKLKDAFDYLAVEKGLHSIFLFDRFETYVPHATEAFFNNLRSLRTHAKYKFSVVFSSTRPLEDMLEPDIFSDFYEYVVDNAIYLSLEDTAGLRFRVQYLEKLTGKTIEESDLDKLTSLTGYHGKLTRIGLEAFFAGNLEDVSQESLLKLKGIQGALKELWLFLTPDEQQDMLMLCSNESCPLPSEFLQLVGLIHNQKITIPLFTEFVKMQKREVQSKILFDSSLNTIKRGEQVISDMLTSSEFRLLTLLLAQEGSIVDRETIIHAVWSDSKSQEGVSEQAIDQLLLRLRKKIEDDPTNPTHIQTVKGRGIKFIQ